MRKPLTIDDVIGKTVRLYGFPGTYTVTPSTNTYGGHGVYAKSNSNRPDRQHGFPASLLSIVEVDGVPYPLRSCPIAPPAEDYPHVPQFEFNDGPQINADQALAAWHRFRDGEKRNMSEPIES